MSEDEAPDDAPERRPDLWLPPGAVSPSEPTFPSGSPTAPGGTSSSSSTWRQPPAWRSTEPPVWQQPTGVGAPPGPPGPARPPYPAWPASATARRARVRRPLLRLGVAAGVFALLTVGVHVAGGASGGRTGGSTRSTAPSAPPGTVATVWSHDATQLRPDLGGAEFLGSLDGSFEQGYVREVAGLWFTITGSSTGAGTVLHAIDPGTGAVRWQRELDGVLCATEPEGSASGQGRSDALYCASVLARDPATGLGTRWRLHRLDPATGEDRRTTDVDAWVTAVHRSGSSFVLLEQRQPAPHAVVHGFSADLRERWSIDLVDRPGQADMFTENRVILRPEPERPGLALDRPRLRDVGDGLLAVWAGQRTAFVDPAQGRLVMMPHCSRLVDDGERLWCNEVDGVTAYSYAGRETVRVRGPRLAFPDDDGVGEDRNRPVFLDDDGAGVSVDVTTGKVGAAWTPPGRGSAFGETTMPSTETADGRTFLVGQAGVMLLDPTKDRVLWRNPAVTVSDVPVVRGGTALLGSTRATVMDLRTGATQGELRFEGLYVTAIGDRLVGVGPEQISLARY